MPKVSVDMSRYRELFNNFNVAKLQDPGFLEKANNVVKYIFNKSLELNLAQKNAINDLRDVLAPIIEKLAKQVHSVSKTSWRMDSDDEKALLIKNIISNILSYMKDSLLIENAKPYNKVEMLRFVVANHLQLNHEELEILNNQRTRYSLFKTQETRKVKILKDSKQSIEEAISGFNAENKSTPNYQAG